MLENPATYTVTAVTTPDMSPGNRPKEAIFDLNDDMRPVAVAPSGKLDRATLIRADLKRRGRACSECRRLKRRV